MYIWTIERWLYLAVIIDLFACRVVGCSTGDRLHRDLALAALRKAVVIRRPAIGLIHHLDRGSQYWPKEYQTELKTLDISIFMSRTGRSFDSAMIETFFKTRKSELVWSTKFKTLCRCHERHQSLLRWLLQSHSAALDFTSPALFEKMAPT